MDPQSVDAINVERFVAGTLKLDPASVNPASRLLHDLGVGGDDAAHFLLAFAEHFQVSLPNWRWEDYFPREPTILELPVTLIRLFKGKSKWAGYKELTVADLVLMVRGTRTQPGPSDF